MPNPRRLEGVGQRGHGRIPAGASSRRASRQSELSSSLSTLGTGLCIDRNGDLSVDPAKGVVEVGGATTPTAFTDVAPLLGSGPALTVFFNGHSNDIISLQNEVNSLKEANNKLVRALVQAGLAEK